MDKLEQAMQSEKFWCELADTSFGKIILHGWDNISYEISMSISDDDEDFAMLFFHSYERLKEWLNKWQGEGFYDYLVELYEKTPDEVKMR